MISMAKVVIANPPLGIYKNPDITIGQAFYIVQLDIHARARKQFLGQDVSFPTYAFNVFGRRGDSKEDPVKFARDYRERPSIRDKLDLCSKEYLSDDEAPLIGGVQQDLVRLNDCGLILTNGNGEAFLDVQKLKGRFTLSSLLDGVSMSDRTAHTLKRYWEENTNSPHQITKPTKFSASNPIGGQNIGPLFGLANLWDYKYPEAEVVMAGSERNLTNYIFLRMLTQMALRGEPGVSQIFVYPQLRFSEGMENWELEKLLLEEFDSDFLRYGFCTTSMSSDGSSSLDKSKLKEGRKFVYGIGNLGRVLNYVPGEEFHDWFLKDVLRFQVSSSLPKLNNLAKDLSNKVRLAKLSGEFEQRKGKFDEEYSELVRTASVITPKICNKIMGTKNG